MKSKLRPSIRRKRLICKLIFILIICTPLIIYMSLNRVDKVCGLPYQDLPTREPQTIEAATKVEAPIYNIPLSKELQQFTYEKCLEYDVDYLMALGLMDAESDFQVDAISPTDDYGIMQINKENHDYLNDAFNKEIDFLDAKQNIEAGVFYLSGICENNTDPNRILMIYNMNSSIAQALWDDGRESTAYSREVMRSMEKIRGKKVQI